MTVQTEIASTYYYGDGVTTQFPIPFLFRDSADVLVTTVLVSTGAGTVLSPGQYTITGAGNANGGQLTITPALASGYKVVIQRNMHLLQTLNMENESALTLEDIETALDNVVLMIQQVRADLAAAAGAGQITSIVQNVIGPVSSVTDRIATFADTVGNRIKDSGLTLADLALVGHTHPETFTGIVKSSDTQYVSTTTLANGPELQFAMAADTTYLINAQLYINAPSTSGFKVGMSGPASPADFFVTGSDIDETGTQAAFGATVYGLVRNVTPGTTRRYVVNIRMRVANGANAGTFALQFAQNASNAAATTILKGSYLQYKAI